MAIYTVTNTNDSDTGSLRSAITKANETSGADIINFDPTVFNTPQTITLTSGELNIQDDLTIQGTGANNLTVSGNNAFRVFDVNDGSNANQIAVVIDGLTITKGNTEGSVLTTGDSTGGGISNRENLTVTNSTIFGNTTTTFAGGIRNFDAGNLTIINSTISGNTAATSNGGINNNGTLTIIDSTISGNTAATFNGGIGNTGTLTITDSTISGNTAATANNGGISNTGTLTITDSTISGNTAAANGGILNNSTLTITHSTISGNTAATFNGGIGNSGTLTITDSTISGNTAATDNSGGISNTASGKLTITDSTISGNTATTGGGILSNGTLIITYSTISGNTAATYDGGGILSNGTLIVTDSTISGNTAATDGGGIRNFGSGNLTVTNSTIANNTADRDGKNIGNGGGIFTDATGTAILNNTIVAKNFDNTPLGGTIRADVSGSFDPNSSFNLIGNGAGSNFISGINSNIVGNDASPIDPLLGTLQNNGGFTNTLALLEGSPAINAGSNANIPLGITTDQRGEGFPRISGDLVDIGAYEFALTSSLIPIATTLVSNG